MLQLHILLQTEKSRLDEERQTLEEQVAVAEKRLREIQVRLRHVEGLLVWIRQTRKRQLDLTHSSDSEGKRLRTETHGSVGRCL